MPANILVASLSQSVIEDIKRSLKALEALEFQLVPATSYALALFLTQKNSPRAIICDFKLADGDGLTFFKELRSDKDLRSIPFIILCDEEERVKLQNQQGMAQIDGVVSKPLMEDELLRTVKHVLHLHKS